MEVKKHHPILSQHSILEIGQPERFTIWGEKSAKKKNGKRKRWFKLMSCNHKKAEKVTNILLFPQVYLLHLLQVFITFPSSIMLEDNIMQCWDSSRTMKSSPWHITTSQANLKMEETQCSCSCSVETKCMCAWLETHMFGDPSTIQPSAGFWSLKCDTQHTVYQINPAKSIVSWIKVSVPSKDFNFQLCKDDIHPQDFWSL